MSGGDPIVKKKVERPVGTGRMFGPFLQVASQTISQVNFRIGANKNPKTTGFSFHISFQSCY